MFLFVFVTKNGKTVFEIAINHGLLGSRTMVTWNVPILSDSHFLAILCLSKLLIQENVIINFKFNHPHHLEFWSTWLQLAYMRPRSSMHHGPFLQQVPAQTLISWAHVRICSFLHFFRYYRLLKALKSLHLYRFNEG